jgi:hypothetical protein
MERSFASLWRRITSMINISEVDDKLGMEIWAECAATATKQSNIQTEI